MPYAMFLKCRYRIAATNWKARKRVISSLRRDLGVAFERMKFNISVSNRSVTRNICCSKSKIPSNFRIPRRARVRRLASGDMTKHTGMIQLKEIGCFLLDIFAVFRWTLSCLNLLDRHSDTVATHCPTEDHPEATHAKNVFLIHIVQISEVFRIVLRSPNHFERRAHFAIVRGLHGFFDGFQKKRGQCLIDHG